MEEHGVRIIVDEDKCTGCKICADLCPANIYRIDGGKSHVKERSIENCFVCRACEVSCPVQAIAVIEKA